MVYFLFFRIFFNKWKCRKQFGLRMPKVSRLFPEIVGEHRFEQRVASISYKIWGASRTDFAERKECNFGCSIMMIAWHTLQFSFRPQKKLYMHTLDSLFSVVFRTLIGGFYYSKWLTERRLRMKSKVIMKIFTYSYFNFSIIYATVFV